MHIYTTTHWFDCFWVWWFPTKQGWFIYIYIYMLTGFWATSEVVSLISFELLWRITSIEANRSKLFAFSINAAKYTPIASSLLNVNKKKMLKQQTVVSRIDGRNKKNNHLKRSLFLTWFWHKFCFFMFPMWHIVCIA